MCDVLRQMAWFLQQMNGKDEKGRGTINGHNAVCRSDLNKLTVERHFWRPSGKAEHNNGCGTHGGKMKHARQSHDIWGRYVICGGTCWGTLGSYPLLPIRFQISNNNMLKKQCTKYEIGFHCRGHLF